MMVFLNNFNNWKMTVFEKKFGYSYCLSNDWSIALKAGFSTVRNGTFSTTKYIATFLDSIFQLCLMIGYKYQFPSLLLLIHLYTKPCTLYLS